MNHGCVSLATDEQTMFSHFFVKTQYQLQKCLLRYKLSQCKKEILLDPKNYECKKLRNRDRIRIDILEIGYKVPMTDSTQGQLT